MATRTAASNRPSQYIPAPTAIPTAAVPHIPAAVVSPRMELPFLKMTPAPRKEMPLTTWAAMRAGSAPRRPSMVTQSRKAYLDTIMNSAEVQAMMQWVRMPASLRRLLRSSPTRAPRAADSSSRIRNSRLSYMVRDASGT